MCLSECDGTERTGELRERNKEIRMHLFEAKGTSKVLVCGNDTKGTAVSFSASHQRYCCVGWLFNFSNTQMTVGEKQSIRSDNQPDSSRISHLEVMSRY